MASTNTSSPLGFIPQAKFLFAKNCNQVWAEAMSEFTLRCGEQESRELPEEAKGEEETEKDQGPEAAEPQLEQKLVPVRGAGWWGGAGHCLGAPWGAGRGCCPGGGLNYSPLINVSHQASPYSMDDTDPRKFFMSGERKRVVTEGTGRPQDALTRHLPSPRLHWLRAPCPLPLWLQLPGAHQPGAAGIRADVLTGRGAEGPQTSLPTPQTQLSESGSHPSLWRLRAG